jgi:hypothetical protein
MTEVFALASRRPIEILLLGMEGETSDGHHYNLKLVCLFIRARATAAGESSGNASRRSG